MILLPIGHERQTVQRLPWVTFILIGICVLVSIYTSLSTAGADEEVDRKLTQFIEYFQQRPYLEIPPEMNRFFSKADHEFIATLRESIDRSMLDSSVVQSEQEELNRLAAQVTEVLNANPLQGWGYVPNDPHFVNLITCMFLHAGFWHLFGNMLFLFLAGCAIEDLWGRPLYLGFYLLSGIAATLVHDFQFSDSAIPIVGASGAIAGLMGAFLVRLARTKIRFFYFFWFLFLGIKMGTFEAPAFIMLPLWFVQQLLYATLTDEAVGVAFWAHIGGFAFGAVFALGMNALKIEEKYIAPEIEKKVSLPQNPMFLQAMDFSEKGEYAQALVLLQKVVRQDPGHVDAFMEMRRISEITQDADSYTRCAGGILDSYLRNHDSEMVLSHYEQYRKSPLRKLLPAKTIFALGAFFEGVHDDAGAAQIFEELVTGYPDDPLSMKGLSKLARLYIEKLHDRDRGVAAFWKGYNHPMSDSQWKQAMQLDMKRYQISPDSTPPVIPAPARIASPQSPIASMSTEARPSNQGTPPQPVAPFPPQPGILPSVDFDGAYTEVTLVACGIDRILLKGLSLRNVRQATALLPWKRIRIISVGKIRTLSSGAPGAKDALIMDLVVPGAGIHVIYRTTGKILDFKKLFPGVDQTFFDAFENFLGILLNNSGARCFPDTDQCRGPVFAEYLDIPTYERRLLQAITKSG